VPFRISSREERPRGDDQCIDEKDWLADTDGNGQPEIATHAVNDCFCAAIRIMKDFTHSSGPS